MNNNIDYEASRRAALYVHFDYAEIQKSIITQNNPNLINRFLER